MLLRPSLILIAICVLSQVDGAQTPSANPADLKLLPGYSSTETIGKDGKTARLTRADGFTITYLSSSPKNFYERSFKSGDDIVWLKYQELNGHRVRVASIKGGEMVVVVDDTQMLKATPEGLDHVADLLLTVSTLYPRKEESTPVTPAGVNPPGNMRLLAGYTYVRRQGKDSHVGSIIGEGGLTINHDIGRMAANYSRKYFPEYFEQLRKRYRNPDESVEAEIRSLEEKVSWRVNHEINDDDLMIAYLKDTTVIASFDRSSANFVAKVDTFQELTDFLLTVLTYQPKPSSKLPK
ncbi:MAG TPA: hypothetical protein VFZ49_06940 [Pyrinomonadaceae bacterium]